MGELMRFPRPRSRNGDLLISGESEGEKRRGREGPNYKGMEGGERRGAESLLVRVGKGRGPTSKGDGRERGWQGRGGSSCLCVGHTGALCENE